jgi:hypothetical protein
VDRPLRVCDICGGVDDHPRHSFDGVVEDVHPVNETARAALLANLEAGMQSGQIALGDALRLGAEFENTTSSDRHIDCCAAAGCPQAGTVDGCDARVAVWNGKTGDGMRKAAEAVRAKHADHYAAAEG